MYLDLSGIGLFVYSLYGGMCLIACCIGCYCKIAYDRCTTHQHQEANQGTLIDLLSDASDNNPNFSREIELSSSPYIEESISLLGNTHEN
jgi:hypothetical protein